MKGYYTRLHTFWLEDLKSYKPLHYTPIAPHAIPHENYSGTMLKQSFNDDLPPCWKTFYQALEVEEGSVCWLTLEPREIIPVHQDHFYMLKTKKNVDEQQCIRYLVMLEDWVAGHYVQLDDMIITNWRAGDVWYFDSSVPHWAANCGNVNFYSCQVSTLK